VFETLAERADIERVVAVERVEFDERRGEFAANARIDCHRADVVEIGGLDRRRQHRQNDAAMLMLW
jgi:hypothetical protein